MRKASKTRRLLEKGGFSLPPPQPPPTNSRLTTQHDDTKSCPRRPRPAAFGSSPAVGHDHALYVRRDGAFFLGAVIGGGGRGRGRGRRRRDDERGGDNDNAWGRRMSQSRQRREQRRQLRTEVIYATACSFWGLSSARRCRCHRSCCVDAPSPGGSSA